MSRQEKKKKLQIVEIQFISTQDDTRLRRVFDILLNPMPGEALLAEEELEMPKSGETQNEEYSN